LNELHACGTIVGENIIQEVHELLRSAPCLSVDESEDFVCFPLLLHQLAIPSLSFKQMALHAVQQHEPEIVKICLEMRFVRVQYSIVEVC
jgi:hypothetical protein